MARLILVASLLFLSLAACKQNRPPKTHETATFENGDLIFQSSLSGQSKAIQLATGSKYSHVGIIIKDGDKLFVYEAIQPVSLTPLQDFIKRGDDQHYVVKRLKDSKKILSIQNLIRMKGVGEKFHNKDYDLKFSWTDDELYCSELVWKIYKEATGIEIGALGMLGDFNLSHPEVKKILTERYGSNVPLKETVISPKAMFESDLLVTVMEQ